LPYKVETEAQLFGLAISNTMQQLDKYE